MALTPPPGGNFRDSLENLLDQALSFQYPAHPLFEAEVAAAPATAMPRARIGAAPIALVAALVVFPPFVLAFWWFYQQVCGGDLRVLSPVLWVEGLTPWAGGLERFLAGLCRTHAGGFWPEGLQLPASWTAWHGLGFVRQVVEGLFAVALAEEVFHRGYLMSALEDLWPPRREVLGAKVGLAAVISSLMFAVGHLVGMAQAARLATFFPALVFAWLWRRSGSLWAPALFHTAANLLMDLLLASTFPA